MDETENKRMEIALEKLGVTIARWAEQDEMPTDAISGDVTK